jgi:hypothetical protein
LGRPGGRPTRPGFRPGFGPGLRPGFRPGFRPGGRPGFRPGLPRFLASFATCLFNPFSSEAMFLSNFSNPDNTLPLGIPFLLGLATKICFLLYPEKFQLQQKNIFFYDMT